MKNTPNEWAQIAKIKSLVQRHNPQTVVPLGDDAFVFKNFPGLSVIAQDMMIEGTHFRLDYSSAADLGHKSLAVNLSDLAAMAATPHFAQVSLALPARLMDEHLTESWLDQFYRGMTALGDLWNVEIVGGDLCASQHSVVIDVSVYGSCEKPIIRDGTQAGDLLLCSGPLGLGHTGLLALTKNLAGYEIAKEKHRKPRPRLDLVPHLQKNFLSVHALMDCSDSLINEALILSKEKLGLQIFIDKLPLHPETLQLADHLKIPASELALWGGEDYELLITVAEKDRALFSDWHLVGQFTSDRGVYGVHAGVSTEITEFKGWRHF